MTNAFILIGSIVDQQKCGSFEILHAALKCSVILQLVLPIDDLVSKGVYSIKDQRQFLAWTLQTYGQSSKWTKMKQSPVSKTTFTEHPSQVRDPHGM